MRSTLLAVAALAFLRIVIGLHFFLEGTSHLRDPGWSSAGFRKAAVGPLADFYRAPLPETGAWSETLGKADGRPVADAAEAWKRNVVAGWRRGLADRLRLVPLDAPGREQAERQLEAASQELDRLAVMEQSPASQQVPFARDRVAKKRRELSAQAAGWMKDADAIGTRLVADWDGPLSAADRLKLGSEATRTPLWKADRFVSWALVTIGACLVVGFLVPFHAMGGACFLASVVASQPFWVPGAQATYDQWVELAALLAIASLPVGGWSGLDFFLGKYLGRWCPLSGCCRTNEAG
jgi:uncharacterized membrane protein YphA (DoxX/SURF4 family)